MKQTGENGLAQMRVLLVFAGALLAGALSYLMAQELRVTSIGLGPDGTPQIQHEAETNYYYILYRGPVTNIVLASDLALGTNGTGELKGPVVASTGSSVFFRVLRVPLDQPLDTDADGIDDVYELRHPTVLLPLRATDAGEDADGDGFTNLEEYQCGTDPAVINGPSVLVNSPSSIVAAEGSSQSLRVFREQDGVRCEVTDDPATTFQSSAPAIVSVNGDGLLEFHASGTVEVTATFRGLTAVSHIVVDSTARPMVQAPIGSAGGELAMANGTGVSIPPNALSSSQMITLEEVPLPPGTILPDDSTMVSSAIDFKPAGLTFSTGVTVTMAVSGGGVPAGYDPESVLIHLLSANNRMGIEAPTGPDGEEDLVESVNQSYDPDTERVSAEVRHFSCRALLARLNPTALTLTAPDGTTLKVLQVLKTEKPSKGADGHFGVANCDDNNDHQANDCGEFEGVGGGSCTGPIDDVSVAVPTRTEAAITHIVLHSTAGANTATFRGEVSWAASRRNCYWAHYYVGKDGTIVQISTDTEIAQHVRDNNTQGSDGFGIGNDNAIGIEIFNNANGTHYPGRQLSAVVRLCDFLMRRYPGIVRPAFDNSTGNLVGNIITHARQDATPGRKTDPTGDFRTDVMGSPSLEEIVSRALLQDGRTNAIINARGGDALGLQTPGTGGDVRFEAGLSALENNFDDHRTTVRVPAGASANFTGSANRMHVLVDGALRFSAATSLDLDGILYVGPQGTLDARGTGLDGSSGFNLNVVSDGFALIEGRVLVNGTDKLAAGELAPFNQPPFPTAGSGNGDGGNGGSFTFRSAAPGPLWVPTIITRGGDADSADANFYKAGGNGGDVRIFAEANNHDDYVLVQFEGRPNDPRPDQAEVGLPDYLPPPAPFNLMPVVTSTPLASGSCPATTDAPFLYVRPRSSERLALGHAIDSASRAVGRDVSRFHRGVITTGGMGGAESSTATNSAGGRGGNIVIGNESPGIIKFVRGIQLISGAGSERLASVIFVVGGGCGDFKYFEIANGCAGGRGALNGGYGGTGGNGGDITITGTIYPNTGATTPGSSAEPILGYDRDNPNFSGGIEIGSFLRFGAEGFSTSSSRGSGGSPGGSSSSFPGWFGPAGVHGTTTINGGVVFP